MFTGIVEEMGKLLEKKSLSSALRLRISASKVLEDLKNGDSICVNGACLTVIDKDAHSFQVDVVEETLKRTTFRSVKIGALLNLERAIKVDGRLGGHFVQGHIDTTAKVKSKRQKGDSVIVEFSLNEAPIYVVEKGFIAVDGVSLTVISVGRDSFSVSLIPFTLENTNLKGIRTGSFVNIEFDIVGKYIFSFLKQIYKEKIQLDRRFSSFNGLI